MALVTSWITKIARLKNSKVARFSYKAEAYANDDIEGVANYDYSRDMNVPLATHTDFNDEVLSVGARTNFSSIPKNGLNHFFGRVSYNLNKVIDFLSDFLDDFLSFTEVIPFTSSSVLTTYADGETKRLLNTSSSTVTITLPAGETYLGNNTIPLAPSIMLTITKRGSKWINSSNVIDDTQATNISTWSSDKINSLTQTLRKSASFTLPTFVDGTRVKIANTNTTDSIICTLPSGQTMNGDGTIHIPAGRNIDLELIGNEWKDSLTGNLTGNADTASKANVRVSLRHGDTWSVKSWTGLTDFNGGSVWTDGENIYYSYGTTQYVLNKANSTWEAKTWTGLTDFIGWYTWTDGENIYYSYGTSQYVLNKTTSTWVAKSWTGLTNFRGDFIWTDGENIYHSNGTTHRVLNKATSTWVAKSWKGLTSFTGDRVWTDGENIYYSYGTAHYVLNKATSTWVAKTWSGLTSFRGDFVWTDGENIYYSDGTAHYVLNKATSTWVAKTWSGLTYFRGEGVWTDGENIYHSYTTTHYELPATRHNYIDDDKYNSLFGTVTKCISRTLTARFVFANE